jgi:hypothetical protein
MVSNCPHEQSLLADQLPAVPLTQTAPRATAAHPIHPLVEEKKLCCPQWTLMYESKLKPCVGLSGQLIPKQPSVLRSAIIV